MDICIIISKLRFDIQLYVQVKLLVQFFNRQLHDFFCPFFVSLGCWNDDLVMELTDSSQTILPAQSHPPVEAVDPSGLVECGEPVLLEA